MIATVKKPDDLVKRVKRFLSRQRSRDKYLARLFNHLNTYPGVYLFGGVLRDIALYGGSKFESDIDLVYTGSQISADSVKIDDIPMEKNKFGGFRMKTSHWSIDIWSAENTWAFQHGFRKYECIESLLDTTITNWDSILYDIKKNKIFHKKYYFDDLNRRYLDVVLDDNPNRLGMYVRIIRTCICKDVYILSNRAFQLINEAITDYSFEEINSYERTHFQDSYVDRSTYDYFKNREHVEDSDIPLDLESVRGNFPLV